MITTKEYLTLYKKYPAGSQKYAGWEEDLAKIVEYNKALIEKYPWLEPWNRWSGKRITECMGDGEEGFWPGVPEEHPDYDYSYTELDSLPEGWRLAFGDQIVEELNEELKKFDFIDKYFITQIKEKYGTLHWYDNGIPVGKLSEDYEVFERRLDDEYPKDWNKDNIYYKYIETKDHKPVFDDNLTKEEREANAEYNKEHAIEVYHKHRIIEKCHIWDIIGKYEDLSEKICIHCGKPAKYVSRGWINYLCEDCAKKDWEANEKHTVCATFDDYFDKIEDKTIERVEINSFDDLEEKLNENT